MLPVTFNTLLLMLRLEPRSSGLRCQLLLLLLLLLLLEPRSSGLRLQVTCNKPLLLLLLPCAGRDAAAAVQWLSTAAHTASGV
jgi:hypothetical protein